MSHSRMRALLVCALTTCVTAAGAAVSADAATIYVCQKKKGGTLRVVSKKTKCKKSEKKFSFNTAGKDGTNGKDGANGTNGTNGKDGTNGTNGAAGEPRNVLTMNGTSGVTLASTEYVDLADTGTVRIRLACVNFIANFTKIEVEAAAGSFQSSAVYEDVTSADPSVAQDVTRAGTLSGSYATFSTLSTNTSGELSNEGHVRGSVIAGSYVVYIDAYVKAAPDSPGPACTVRGTAAQVPIALMI